MMTAEKKTLTNISNLPELTQRILLRKEEGDEGDGYERKKTKLFLSYRHPSGFKPDNGVNFFFDRHDELSKSVLSSQIDGIH